MTRQFTAAANKCEGHTHVLLITTGSVASIKAPLIVEELLKVSNLPRKHPPRSAHSPASSFFSFLAFYSTRAFFSWWRSRRGRSAFPIHGVSFAARRTSESVTSN